MGYRGMMDGWNGDENECHGRFCMCVDCDSQFYQACDDTYDAYQEDDQ